MLLNMMRYLKQLPWISPCICPERRMFTAIRKKKFGEYTLLNIDILPSGWGGKCLRTTCFFAHPGILTCLIILMQHGRQEAIFYKMAEITSPNQLPVLLMLGLLKQLRPGFYLVSRPPAGFQNIFHRRLETWRPFDRAFTFSRKLRSISSLNFSENAVFSQMSGLQLR